MSRLAYFARETVISLRRNLLMTMAGILTVTISLFLFGGILLVSRVVDHGTERWKHDVQLEIFMRVDANQKQIDTVRDALHQDRDVRSSRYLTHREAYDEFKRIFHDQPDLVSSVTPEALPTSFRVAPVKPEYQQRIDNEFHGRPGVESILTAQKTVDQMLTATRWIRLGFFAMASVLLASSLFLIVNTIRLATYARRREIEVMKLVGASNWFVRIPFMAEGLVQGALGAGLAFGSVFALKVILAHLLHRPTVSLVSTFYVTNWDAIGIGLLVLLIGAVVGVAGSAIGLRRFLDV